MTCVLHFFYGDNEIDFSLFCTLCVFLSSYNDCSYFVVDNLSATDVFVRFASSNSDNSPNNLTKDNSFKVKPGKRKSLPICTSMMSGWSFTQWGTFRFGEDDKNRVPFSVLCSGWGLTSERDMGIGLSFRHRVRIVVKTDFCARGVGAPESSLRQSAQKLCARKTSFRQISCTGGVRTKHVVKIEFVHRDCVHEKHH